MVDGRLVVLAQAGDRSAFEQLAERHSARLRRVLFRITRDCDAAYDAVQEALMRAWSGMPLAVLDLADPDRDQRGLPGPSPGV